LNKDSVDLPIGVVDAFGRTFERIGEQIVKVWHTQLGEFGLPNTDGTFRVSFTILLHKRRSQEYAPP